jgi:predicted phage terminase large subunit-like protein
MAMQENNLENFFSGRADPRLILDELDRIDAEESLKSFIQLTWPILEPGREFVSGWHIDAICDHLQAVTDGKITRLLINVPPGFMKSLTTEVFWPAWEWGPRNLPSTRYVSSSYSEALTVQDNRRTRNLIKAPLYQKHWGDRFTIDSSQDAKMRFDNDHMGFKIATSVGGLGTGERGDRVIIDDPHNVKEGESPQVRESTLRWFTEVMPTRVNDPEKSAIIVIMQRVHEEDISGYIIAKELGYDCLILPMEYEPERHCTTSIGFSDPRTEENELMWPDRMTRAVIERDKKILGSYAVAGQFQQRPAPRGGGMFQRDWFEVVDAAPAGRKIVRGWDLASTEGEDAAYTAGVKMSEKDGIFYIEHVNRFRGSPDKVERALKNTASDDGISTTIDIPQDPGQAGKSQKAYLSKQLVGYNVRFSPESGDKEMRAAGLAAQAEAGNVKVIRGSWNGDFFDEACTFPSGKFKDQIDGASRAFHALIKKRPKTVPCAPVQIKLR